MILDFNKKISAAITKARNLTPGQRVQAANIASSIVLGAARGAGSSTGGMTIAQMAKPALLSKFKGGLGAIPSMKKGGKVKKTGLHLLHKGEMVIPAAISARMR